MINHMQEKAAFTRQRILPCFPGDGERFCHLTDKKNYFSIFKFRKKCPKFLHFKMFKKNSFIIGKKPAECSEEVNTIDVGWCLLQK